MSDLDNEYLLGSRDEELIRLDYQHRVWSAQSFAQWERAGFGPGQTLLDLGCGPGFATFELASLVGPSGRVIAVDGARRFLDYVDRQLRLRDISNVEIRQDDVQRLRLPRRSIDGAYARWLLCFLPEPEAVVASVAESLRPGGAFAAMDYFNYHAFTLIPRSEALDRVVRAISESWRSHGGDLDVMSSVPRWMQRHGLDVVHVAPIVRVVKAGSAFWHWPGMFFKNYLPSLVESGFLTREEHEALTADWDQRSCDPSTYLCTPPMLEVIGVRR